MLNNIILVDWMSKAILDGFLPHYGSCTQQFTTIVLVTNYIIDIPFIMSIVTNGVSKKSV